MSGGKRKRELAAKGRYWGNHMTGWSGSGLSQAEYCRHHGLASHNLSYWVRKLERPPPFEAPAPPGSGSVELVEVEFGGPIEPVPEVDFRPLRVVIGARFVIEISGDFDGPILEKLTLSLARASDRLM